MPDCLIMGFGFTVGFSMALLLLVGVSIKRAFRINELRREVDRLEECLEFYADPDSYFAVMVIGDPPCGEFAYDMEPDATGRLRPGKRARAILYGEDGGGDG